MHRLVGTALRQDRRSGHHWAGRDPDHAPVDRLASGAVVRGAAARRRGMLARDTRRLIGSGRRSIGKTGE
jgi:hypothetical protein